MAMTAIAVIGAGTIGRGLALDLAMHGHDVLLNDVDEETLRRALEAIRSELRSYRLLVQEYREADEDTVLGRITFAPRGEDVATAEFVHEYLVEDYATKAR